MSAIDCFCSPLATKILESLIKKCGAGRMRYEMSAEVLKFILNSLSNLLSILLCTHVLLYKRGTNK